MSRDKVLAPHAKQDGFVYIRVPRGITRWFTEKRTFTLTPLEEWHGMVAYRDDLPGSRTISSRRVEEDVETGDYLKRCADEGVFVGFNPSGDVKVQGPLDKYYVHTAPTLREAYFRFHAATDKAATR